MGWHLWISSAPAVGSRLAVIDRGPSDIQFVVVLKVGMRVTRFSWLETGFHEKSRLTNRHGHRKKKGYGCLVIIGLHTQSIKHAKEDQSLKVAICDRSLTFLEIQQRSHALLFPGIPQI